MALALHGEVELALVETAAPVHHEHGAVRRIERDERSLWAVRAREPLVDRGARQLLQLEIDRGVDAEAAAEDALRPELVDQLLLDVLAEVRRLTPDAGEMDVLRPR